MKNNKILLLFILAIAFILLDVERLVSKQKIKIPFKFKKTYKKIHRQPWKNIKAGKVKQGIKYLKAFLKKRPGDLESLFMLTIAYGKINQEENALKYFKKALSGGLPPSRFLAGPRQMFKTLYGDDEFKNIMDKLDINIIHGPMLGNLTGNEADIWIRTNRQVPVRVKLFDKNNPDKKIITDSIITREKDDFTGIVKIKALEPETEYLYLVQVKSENKWIGEEYNKLKTPPVKGKKGVFTIAFGGGAGYSPKNERMWQTINSFAPDALLLLGDNVYFDFKNDADYQRYCYYRRQSRAEFRSLVDSVPVYAIWDDHDFCGNDCAGGPKMNKPKWKRLVWNIFKQNWVNPYYGGGEKHPGCWFDFSIGDIDFFLLDGRYYRTKPETKKKSMLGNYQKFWLLNSLKESKAAFKVIVSSVPWSFEAKADSLDTWNGFKKERNKIFNFLKKNNIEGVILLSADRHRSEIWRNPRTGAYDLIEFESSRLTNQHKHKKVPGSIYSYNKKQSFGLLTFDTTKSNPLVVFKIINIDGRIIYTYKVKKNQIM